MARPPLEPPSKPDAPPAAPTPVPPIDSESLLRGCSEVVIRHNGRVYRLRRTRLGKLILTA